jgi:sec-independent protein translocase protein TatB
LSGIGPSELIVLVVVGLLILGPERLPRVATQIGRWVGRARRTANQLRYQLEREITLADIEGKKKEKEKAAQEKKSAEPSADSGVDTAGPSDAAGTSDTPDTSDASENITPGASENEATADDSSEDKARTD